jgi:transposase
VLVTAASVQDRDSARPLLQRLAEAGHRVRHVWADGGYAGKLLDWARDTLRITVQIVKRSDDMTAFVVLPRRWVVERSLAWITRHSRCTRDYEALPAHHEAMVRWSMIRITSRRLTRP